MQKCMHNFTIETGVNRCVVQLQQPWFLALTLALDLPPIVDSPHFASTKGAWEQHAHYCCDGEGWGQVLEGLQQLEPRIAKP